MSIDTSTSKALDITKPIDYTSTNAVKRVPSADGLGGVLFVQNKEGVYVVKADSDCAREYFAIKLAQMVGLRTTQCNLLTAENAQWFDARIAVMKVADVECKIFLKSKFDRSLYLEIEYVPGPDLRELALTGVAKVADRDFWVSCGEIMAFDIFINNCDRIPAGVWSSMNMGNPGNVILARDSKKLVAIDTIVSNVNPRFVPAQQYIQRSREVLLEVLANPSLKSTKMGQHFSKFCKKRLFVRIGDSHFRLVVEGLKRMIPRIAKLTDAEIDPLYGMIQKRTEGAMHVFKEFLYQMICDVFVPVGKKMAASGADDDAKDPADV